MQPSPAVRRSIPWYRNSRQKKFAKRQRAKIRRYEAQVQEHSRQYRLLCDAQAALKVDMEFLGN